MPETYDVIVLGVGGMGAATLMELARRGHRVLGIEQFPLVHTRGSSHGQTRVIRQAYYEHPAYVPLARRAYERWYDLEQQTGRHLFTRCGCLTIGPPVGELYAGVRASVTEHQLPVEFLTGTEVSRRFPAFQFDDGMSAVLESNAGYLAVEECVQAHLDLARRLGAVVRAEEPVRNWQSEGSGVRVQTDLGTYQTAKLIVTAGAWATHWLADIGVPLTVMRQVMQWFAPRDAALVRRDRMPVFIAETATGAFYGTPAIDPRGAKVAQHYGAPELPTPDAVEWTIHESDEPPVRKFVAKHLPAANGPRTTAQVCQYTLSPNRHFILDTHPDWPQITLAAGFSGHGFKFASVVGEILADLAESGQTSWPIHLFRQCRTRNTD